MSRRIRVLHVIKSFGLGGAETNLLNLAKTFDRDVVETHVAYSHGGELERQFIDAGLALFKYSNGIHRVKSVQTIAIVLRLAAYIRRKKIDVVHTHNFNGHVWGLLAAKLAGARVVEHVHDFRYTSREELAKRHGLFDQYRFIKYFQNRSDRVVVLTRENLRYVIDNGLGSAERVLEIPNGVPFSAALSSADRARATRRALSIADDALVILTPARMDPTKNIDLILRIAREVTARHANAVFVVAGNGPLLEALRSESATAGLGNHVRFIGFQNDVEALLEATDVFLLPSFLELHSIAILEAMKAQKPIVVSAGVGCNDEFVEHGVNGFLCDPFVDSGWSSALLGLLQDDDLRKHIGRNGFATCRSKFDIRLTTSRFENLYRELVPGRT